MNGLDFVRDNRDIIKEKILNFYNLEKYNVVSTVVGIMLHASNASVIMGIHGKYSSEFSSRKSSFIIDTTNCKHLDHYVDRARTLQINSENASMCELGNMTFQPESNAAIFEGQTLMIANEKRRNCIPDSVGHPLPTCGKLTNQNSRCFLQLQTIQFVDHFRRNRGETITRLQCFDMDTGAVVQKGFLLHSDFDTRLHFHRTSQCSAHKDHESKVVANKIPIVFYGDCIFIPDNRRCRRPLCEG